MAQEISHREDGKKTDDWDDRGNAERWRTAAADAINKALREAGFTQGFVDPRSYTDQGVQHIPMVHEGPDARAMEKRGIPTEIGEKNREIRQQKWKKYRKHHQAWEKLPEAKRGDFERSHEYKLRQYRQAAAALQRWQADGEKIDYKGWKTALDYLSKEQFI